MPRKAKKKAESVDTTSAGTKHVANEPELKSASDAGLDRELDREADARMRAVSPAAPGGEVEQLAEAADTFEQAYDEVSVPEPREPAPVQIDAPQQKVDQTELHAKENAEAEAEPPGDALPARLERLQKILSQAGVASRRHAEEMITEGRVQVNGKVVTELGSKADAERDHIRVDGKLIRGAERLRYFVLNKPKGYVTTVSDPEGRPTVMQLFQKMNERLYPVGRLDYLSEGLLLVTNDGDLANKLTKAATGVEKTYLVKVSGQPSEAELDRLREGVAIDRGRPGDGRVHTAPVTIREARSGDNPWYEVILTEGRNRELRKMFEEIGHFVEKIRRVGYGPLILDVEPGQFRELEAEELAKLRLAAEGKWRKPKPKPAPQGRSAPRRERGTAPVREDRRRAGGFGERSAGRDSRQSEQGKDWKKPRFEKPAERRKEGVGRSQTGGRATGRGYVRREEGASYPKAAPPRAARSEGRGPDWKRDGAPPRADRRPFSGGGGQRRQDDRPRLDGARTDAGRGARGNARDAFSRPAKPGQARVQGRDEDRNRVWQPRREQPRREQPRREQPQSLEPRSGKDGAARTEIPNRRNDRGSGARPAGGSGAQRTGRPGGRTERPGPGRPPGGTKSTGRRPSSGRRPTDRPRGDRGKRR